MTQTITTNYVLNSSTAKQEIAALQVAEDKLGASSSKMAQGLAHAERVMASMQTSAKSLQQKLAPAASAIAGVTSALGDHNGAAGKAIAATGQLAGAFASGGPFGLALAAAVIGVQALTKSWDDEIVAQDKALASAYAGVDKAAAVRSRVNVEIAALRSKIGGPETGAQASARVQTEIDDVRRTRDEVIGKRNALKVGTDGYDDARKRLEGERAILEDVIRRLEVKQGLAFLAAKQGTSAGPGSGAPTKAAGFKPDAAADEAAGRAAAMALAEMEAEENLEQWRQDQEVARYNQEQEWFEARLALKEDDAARELAINLAKYQRLEAEYEQHLGEVTALSTQATGIVVGASSALVNDLITQQDHAFERFAQTLMAQAGQALIGHGINALGGGLAEAALTGGALGGPAIATGLGLIAGGVALGGAAAGVGVAIDGGGGGGGPARSVSSPRSSSSPSTSSSAPRTTEINIVYGGPNGPVAEEVGRSTRDALRRSERRGRR